MQLIISFGLGLLFGIGLIISGMSNPHKVLAFLDLGGAWDPSLLLVMGGAVFVGTLAFRLAGKRQRTLLGGLLHLPSATAIDRRLVLGSLTFGVGWGLAGFCPGPALASLASGYREPLIFTAAMLAGMATFEILERLRAARTSQAA